MDEFAFPKTKSTYEGGYLNFSQQISMSSNLKIEFLFK